MRRALVTGAAGFLGRHVVADLRSRGWAVRATDRAIESFADADAEAVAIDLEHGDLAPLMRGITHVVHVAGLFDLAAPIAELRRANVDVARRVAEAAHGVERFVHVSSVTVHGTPRGVASESTPLRACRPYARSKREGEDAVRAVRGLPLVILRPSGIYGPHGRYGIAAMAAAIALAAAGRAQHRSLRGGAKMTHVHVEDVASACAVALESDVRGAFHVADGAPIEWGDVAATIEAFYRLPETDEVRMTPWRVRAMQLVGRLAPSRIARANASLARKWDALVAERGLVPALRPRIDLDAYDYWASDHVYDASAMARLGWTPRWSDPRAGLRATLEWCVRERWLPPAGGVPRSGTR